MGQVIGIIELELTRFLFTVWRSRPGTVYYVVMESDELFRQYLQVAIAVMFKTDPMHARGVGREMYLVVNRGMDFFGGHRDFVSE